MLETLPQTHATARFDPEPAAPRKARRFVTETLAHWSCDPLLDVASLLTSELVTNAVLHARTPVELTLCRTDGGVRVEVADEDPESVERALRQRRRQEATTGRGLAMVDALASHWGVTLARSGKSIWFELGRVSEPTGPG
jgi:anti-sigma regulatory factor (Ser/Thr protein kinase)